MQNLSTNTRQPIIAVAPMMDWTDRHDRYFLRLIAPNIRLYTEMLTMQALTFGDYQHLLAFDPSEKYLALQLGGSNPACLAECAKKGEEAGYDEINLNVGCPSPRVSSGGFGACLMLEPNLVADCITAMQAAITIPVTVKCRIGVDNEDSYEKLSQFIKLIASTGCQTFIIHARKAWLSGLSPKQNREIPPLCYERVYQIKQDFPHLTILINGGITTLNQVDTHINKVDGVMIGRAAYGNPYFLAELQAHYFPDVPVLTREQVIENFYPYIEKQLHNGEKLSRMTRHILGLYQGQRGAAIWRRHLSENAHKACADVKVVEQALSLVANFNS